MHMPSFLFTISYGFTIPVLYDSLVLTIITYNCCPSWLRMTSEVSDSVFDICLGETACTTSGSSSSVWPWIQNYFYYYHYY